MPDKILSKKPIYSLSAEKLNALREYLKPELIKLIYLGVDIPCGIFNNFCVKKGQNTTIIR